MIKITLRKGWDRLLRAISPRRARKHLHAQMRLRINQQLQLLRSDVIRYIDGEKHGVPNSPLTILIKGSSKPLVDRGDLRKSVNVDVRNLNTRIRGRCGVIKFRHKGSGFKNVAVALHEGFTIKVTPKVRAAVMAELRKRQKGKVRFDSSGGGGSKSTWVVKGRPYLGDPWEEAQDRIRRALSEGVKVTFKKL